MTWREGPEHETWTHTGLDLLIIDLALPGLVHHRMMTAPLGA